MGFLKDLFKNGISDDMVKGVSDAIDKAVNTVSDTVSSAVNNAGPTSASAPAPDTRAEDTGTNEYFRGVIDSNIDGVEVRENVRLRELVDNVPERSVDIDLLILKDGVPKAAVLLVPKHGYKSLAVTNTMQECESQGIRPMRFMREFRNDAGYVADRIKAAL